MTLTTLEARLANFPIAGMLVAVPDVLGNLREAVINDGAGFPWFNCPFCSSGVYVNGHGPNVPDAVISNNCECVNPWCLANPNMPVAEAERIYTTAARELADKAERQRNHDRAMARIDEENAARRERYAVILEEANRRGACISCAFASAASYSREVRYVKHRGPCPRQRRGYRRL